MARVATASLECCKQECVDSTECSISSQLGAHVGEAVLSSTSGSGGSRGSDGGGGGRGGGGGDGIHVLGQFLCESDLCGIFHHMYHYHDGECHAMLLACDIERRVSAHRVGTAPW